MISSQSLTSPLRDKASSIRHTKQKVTVEEDKPTTEPVAETSTIEKIQEPIEPTSIEVIADRSKDDALSQSVPAPEPTITSTSPSPSPPSIQLPSIEPIRY